MTRKYPTTMINVTREGTEWADYRRERAKPAQDTPKPAPMSEPAPAPEVLPQPKPGRGRALKIVSPIRPGTVVMEPEQARALRNMFKLAAETTSDRDTQARLRRAHNEVVKATRGNTL